MCLFRLLAGALDDVRALYTMFSFCLECLWLARHSVSYSYLKFVGIFTCFSVSSALLVFSFGWNAFVSPYSTWTFIFLCRIFAVAAMISSSPQKLPCLRFFWSAGILLTFSIELYFGHSP